MTECCAVMFPGQGAYLPGALAPLADDEPMVEETLRVLDAAAVRAGRTAPSRFLLDEKAPSLPDLVDQAPADLHAALFAAEATLFRVLTKRHGLRPKALVGHSFGELVALTAAGVYGLEEGMALVAARDEAFAACPPVHGGMVALGISAPRAEGLLTGLAEWEVTLAADNSPRQSVVSGPAEPLERVRAAAQALGISATALQVPYAFHHRLLAAVAGDFARRAATLRTGRAHSVLHSAILGRRVEDGDAAADLVAAHLVRPTRFTEAVRGLHAEGVDVFVECGPRGVLSDLVAETVPGVRIVTPLRRRAGGRELAEALAGLATDVPGPTVPQPQTPRNGSTAPTLSQSRAGATAAEAVPARPAASGHDVLPDRQAIVDTLRALYAEALGYPPEVLTEGADLEADLGVDSIKQIELFAQAAARYGRAVPSEGFRLTSCTTLAALAELLGTLPADGARTAGVVA